MYKIDSCILHKVDVSHGMYFSTDVRVCRQRLYCLAQVSVRSQVSLASRTQMLTWHTILRLLLESELLDAFLFQKYIQTTGDIKARVDFCHLALAGKSLHGQNFKWQIKTTAFATAARLIKCVVAQNSDPKSFWPRDITIGFRGCWHDDEVTEQWPATWYPANTALSLGRVHVSAAFPNRVYLENQPGFFTEFSWCSGCKCLHAGSIVVVKPATDPHTAEQHTFAIAHGFFTGPRLPLLGYHAKRRKLEDAGGRGHHPRGQPTAAHPAAEAEGRPSDGGHLGGDRHFHSL